MTSNAGKYSYNIKYMIYTVENMHSRFGLPFLAGFP